MNLIVAKPEAVLGFMLFKGWRLEETNEMYYILTSSALIKGTTKPARFPIPRNEKAEDFSFQINNIVNHIARLCKWDKTLLLLFLSVKSEDIDTLFQEWLRSGLQDTQRQTNLPRPSISVSFSAVS